MPKGRSSRIVAVLKTAIERLQGFAIHRIEKGKRLPKTVLFCVVDRSSALHDRGKPRRKVAIVAKRVHEFVREQNDSLAVARIRIRPHVELDIGVPVRDVPRDGR